MQINCNFSFDMSINISWEFFWEVNLRSEVARGQNLAKIWTRIKKITVIFFCKVPPPPFFFCFYFKNVFLGIAPFFDGHISGLMFSLAITLPQDVCYGGLIRTYLIAGVLQVIVLRRVDQNLPHCWCSPGDFTTPGWSEPTLLHVNSGWLYYSG